MTRSAAGPPEEPAPDDADTYPAAPAPGWESVVEAIGPKVRDLRRQSGLSLQQLTRRADVSAAAIHKVERGDMVPTITTLLKLATALGRPIGHFVDEDPQQTAVASFVPAGGRSVLAAPSALVARAGIAGPADRFRIAAWVAVVEPGAAGGDGDGAPRSGEELVLVLEGRLAFEVAGERYTVCEGDALHYPVDRYARWTNPGDVAARAVWLSTRGI